MGNWLMHYAKGETAKNHKWVERKRGPKGWIYKYDVKLKTSKQPEKINRNNYLRADQGYRTPRHNIETAEHRSNHDIDFAKDYHLIDKARRTYGLDRDEEIKNTYHAYMKDSYNAQKVKEEEKRRESSELAAKQRKKINKISNKIKKEINDIFGKKTTYVRDKGGKVRKIIFKNGLSTTTVTFGEVKVH